MKTPTVTRKAISKPLDLHGIAFIFALSVAFTFAAETRAVQTSPSPNVILIMTDDQGYGDVSAHGNPVLKTPHLDKLRDESVRFTDFHVAPKCTPTRGQLLTGLDAMRNGATRVCQGLSMVHRDIKMMPQYFSDTGYATAMFGKWHLGDSYPHRPRFRGFQEVLSLRAWGFTSLADHWGNSYFDPVLMHNGTDTPYKGYCTDIFFNEAMAWMAQCQKKGRPFFVYLPTNTPHVPNISPKESAAPYIGNHNGVKIPDAFYGMVANIDDNIGRLEDFLETTGLRDNTILIFLSDNGTQSKEAHQIHNAGMRDRKGSLMDGGHRVPLFVRWINGKLLHGTDFPDLTIVQDLLPTLIELCSLDAGETEFDGTSLVPLLKGAETTLKERISVIQFGPRCTKWDNAVVMKDKWRLLAGPRLYNVADDPHQDSNMAAQQPELVKELSAHYDEWFAEAKLVWDLPRYTIIGNHAANPVTLYASDWIGDYCDNSSDLMNATGEGFWHLIVEREGDYRIELRRWPEESGKTLAEPWSQSQSHRRSARPISQANLQLADVEQTISTEPDDHSTNFRVHLKPGKTRLTAIFLDRNGEILCGAMFVKITRINEN